MNTSSTDSSIPENFRCGYIAIVGRPNVGKSTLMNQLIGAKVSITSRKAQTTRHRITGIQTLDDAQFIYVDTPGFQTRHSNALNKTLNKTVTNTLISADVILYLVEAGTFGPADQQVVDLLPKEVPVILVINKSDRVKDKAALMPFAQQIAAKLALEVAQQALVKTPGATRKTKPRAAQLKLAGIATIQSDGDGEAEAEAAPAPARAAAKPADAKPPKHTETKSA